MSRVCSYAIVILSKTRMKKVVFFVLLLSIFTAIGIFVYQIFFLKNEKGALQVTATPQSKVYLNGEFIGTTPLCLCPPSDTTKSSNPKGMLPVGSYTIRLVPTTGNYSEFQEKITVEKSVLTVVDRKFEQGTSSEAVVISLNNIHDEKKNELVVLSLPDKADVLLDDSLSGQTPLSIKNITASDHTLTIQKQGYKTKTIRIRTTDGYKLITKGYLGIDPLSVAGEQTTASASATPTISVAKIRVLQTGTGFLRVREESSLGGKEIGRVSPGEEFALLEEMQGWYQIQLADGTKGWISSQYAEKLP